jgi:hypothetical protein
MSGLTPKIVLVLLLSQFSLSAQTTPATPSTPAKHAARKHKAKPEPPAPPPAPAPPPLPPTLEQMPAVPPKVTFNNGMLTIVAENSTLSDVLRAVRTQTGAAVEIPANATERVVTHLGPGVPRDVLATLLNGSHFNYVMLGSPTDPNKVDRVILTSKAGLVPDAGPSPPVGQNGSPPVPVDDTEPQPGMDVADQPAEDGADNSTAQEGQQTAPSGQPQVKTPEQLLRELQQQQQQQQQQQPPAQGAPSGTPPSPPR